MSNFKFLQQEWFSLYKKMITAEERVNSEPVSTASYCRLVIEECMYLIYDFEHLEKPFNRELVNLMNQEEIKALIPFQIREGLHIVRKTGNNAVHYGNRVSSKDAQVSIRYTFDFLKWFSLNYSKDVPLLPSSFNMQFVSKLGEKQRQLKELQKEQEKAYQLLLIKVEELEAEKQRTYEKAQEDEVTFIALKEQTENELERLNAQKRNRSNLKLSSEFTEAETRSHLIDVALKEAGWFELRPEREIEYSVSGMPITNDNPKGNGFVDYVLWDDNGKPLALIEAKRTTKDVEVGKHQAYLYANALEKCMVSALLYFILMVTKLKFGKIKYIVLQEEFMVSILKKSCSGSFKKEIL